MITKFQLEALQVVQAVPGISAYGFAQKLWPDVTHRKRARLGGAHLGKLAHRGFVNRRFDVVGEKVWYDGYEITDEGRAALAAAKGHDSE